MKFSKTSHVDHPADEVLDLLIHRVEQLVPFMPSIERIELREKEEIGGGKLRIVRDWQGTADNVPSLVRPFLSRDLLGWTDTARWSPAEYKVDWQFSTSLSHLFECSGTNYFEPDPRRPATATRIRITGNLHIYPEQLPGVPSFLAGRVAPAIEKWVVDMLAPNLTDLAQGLQGYLDSGGR